MQWKFQREVFLGDPWVKILFHCQPLEPRLNAGKIQVQAQLSKSNEFSRMSRPCLFSRGHATLELAVSVGRSRNISVFRSCPPVRDWGGVYTTLFPKDILFSYG